MTAITNSFLPIRPKPKFLESLEGYLIRVAESNCYPSPSYVTDNLSQLLTIKSRDKDNFCLPNKITYPLKERLNLSDNEINALNYPRPTLKADSDLLKIGKATIRREDIKFEKRHICPYCIKENGYITRLWEIQAYTTCPKHHCALIAQCYQCSTKLTSRRNSLLHCHIHELNLPKLPKEECEFAEIIEAKVLGKDIRNELLIKYNPVIHFPLHDFLTAFRIMATITFHLRHQYRDGGLSHKLSSHYFTNEIFNNFSDWPNNWFQQLQYDDELYMNAKPLSLKAKYKKYYETFLDCDPKFFFMRDAFNQWIIEKHPIINARDDFKKLLGKSSNTEDYITVSQAMNLLNVTRNTIYKWADKGFLEMRYDVTGCNEKKLVAKKSANKLLVKKENSLSKKATAEILNTTPRVVDKLSYSKVIYPQDSDFPDYSFFRLAEIQALIETIENAVTSIPKNDIIHMHAALAISANTWAGIGPIIHGIINRKIRINHYDKNKGLASITLSKIDLIQLLDESVSEDGLWCSFEETKNLLNVPRKVVPELISANLLTRHCITYGNIDKYHVIARDEVNNFKNRYISNMEIEKLTGKYINELQGKFRKCQIQKVTDYIYYRADINRYLDFLKTNFY